MNGNFSINPNFQMSGFENSINDFNKAFSSSMNNIEKGLNSNSEFDKIFNSIEQNAISGGVEYIEKKPAPLSPVAKMAQDIGSGFSKSINELNKVDRKAESDFETFASGGDISIHDVMISAQKSSLAMQMAIQLRNQMLNAYNEFKNMQV